MKHEDVVIILRDQADKLISSIPDYQLKFTAALTVVFGWLISVDETRNYIVNHAVMFKPAIVIKALKRDRAI